MRGYSLAENELDRVKALAMKDQAGRAEVLAAIDEISKNILLLQWQSKYWN